MHRNECYQKQKSGVEHIGFRARFLLKMTTGKFSPIFDLKNSRHRKEKWTIWCFTSRNRKTDDVGVAWCMHTMPKACRRSRAFNFISIYKPSSVYKDHTCTSSYTCIHTCICMHRDLNPCSVDISKYENDKSKLNQVINPLSVLPNVYQFPISFIKVKRRATGSEKGIIWCKACNFTRILH